MGPFDRFNDRAKRVLALSQDEAVRFNHDYIGTEHLLMGLIREGEGTAARVLESLGVDLSKLRRTIEASIGRGNLEKPPSEITLHPQVKKVFDLAIDEARKLGHSHVGTEHLLLGIVREGADSPAARALASFGVDLEKVRHQTIATLGQAASGAGPGTPMLGVWAPPTTRGRGSGPFDRFNDRAKRVLALAQDEAIRFNHNYIGTEHILLGLAREGEGIAGRALDALGITLSRLRTSVEKMIGRGDSTTSPSEITLSPRTKKLIELAIDEARRLGHGAVGTEHLLLGLLREGGHAGTQAIESLGVTLESVREKVMSLLGRPADDVGRQGSPPVTSAEFTGGPYEYFNDRAKKVLAIAHEEAFRLKLNYVGTEHLLLGLVREGQSIAARVLDSLGIELSKVRTAVEFIIGAGDDSALPKTPSELMMSPRTKKVIELAIDESRRLGQSHVGPEHLLLGLVREGQGIASGVIESLGVTLEKVRQQLLSTLGRPDADVESFPGPFLLASGPFNLIDDVAKRVLMLAEEEARLMRHNWIGTEHLLIALIRYGMSRHLHQLGVTLELARAGVFKAVPPKEVDVTEITVTPRVRTLLGKAIMLAAPSGEKVRPHHLLLALVDDPGGIGARVLIELGATADKVRAAIAKETGG
jgi:ATP-dependent Clp protease ATP-binding subunit ClpA